MVQSRCPHSRPCEWSCRRPQRTTFRTLRCKWPAGNDRTWQISSYYIRYIGRSREWPISFKLVVLGQRNATREEHKISAIITFRFGPRSAFRYGRRQDIMKTKLLVGMLLAGSSLFAATHVSIGVGVGGCGFGYAAAPPPPVVAYATPYPGPGYSRVDGYWYQAGPRRLWHAGYWAPPGYGRA